MKTAFLLTLLLQGCVDAPGEWSAMSQVDAPVARTNAVTVWTGSEVLVWGGWIQEDQFYCPIGANAIRTGGLYDPVNDTWAPITAVDAPGGEGHEEATYYARVYWTGTQPLVWDNIGGDSQVPKMHLYDPNADVWTTVFAPADMLVPEAKYQTTWTDTELIIWASGYDSAAYNPQTDTWRSIATYGERDRVWESASAWAGTEVLIWVPAWSYSGSGDWDDPPFGARYSPATDTWTPMSIEGGPGGIIRQNVAYWSGDEFLVPTGNHVHHYDPLNDRWTESGSGLGGDEHAEATWMGDRIAFWGDGYGAKIYDPATREWEKLPRKDRPSDRSYPALQWTGDALMVWGGGSVDPCDEDQAEGGAIWRP